MVKADPQLRPNLNEAISDSWFSIHNEPLMYKDRKDKEYLKLRFLILDPEILCETSRLS